jgi:glycosyltransferase involved in cell wall biosynthesis
MSAKAPEVSIVVPARDEAESLEVLAGEIRGALDGSGLDYELIVVDDGSTDSTPEVLRRLAAVDGRVRVVRQRRRAGQSAALDAGFRHARGELVVTLDGDLQNDPADVPRLLAELADCDLVCGVRTERRDGWHRRASSRIANAVRNRVTGERIADVGCGLKAYRAEVLRRMPRFDGMHRFLPTLMRLAGARVKEVPVGHRPRLHGESKYGVGNRLWRALADLAAVRWMQRRALDRGISEEIADWTTTSYGSPSDSAARPYSSAASSSSGSPPSAARRA